jgi:hypothetical protein
MFENGVPRRIFGLTREEQETGENYTVRNFRKMGEIKIITLF